MKVTIKCKYYLNYSSLVLQGHQSTARPFFIAILFIFHLIPFFLSLIPIFSLSFLLYSNLLFKPNPPFSLSRLCSYNLTIILTCRIIIGENYLYCLNSIIFVLFYQQDIYVQWLYLWKPLGTVEMLEGGGKLVFLSWVIS